MDPHEFLRVADELSVAMEEAEWRTAVSRAYYAVFHQSRRLLEQCGFAVPKADHAHAYLWLRLSNCGHTDVILVGIKLKELRSLRNQADYDLQTSQRHKECMGAMVIALNIMEILDEALTTPEVQSAITQTIREYETNVLKQPSWHS